MKERVSIPDRAHVSAAFAAANPHLYPQAGGVGTALPMPAVVEVSVDSRPVSAAAKKKKAPSEKKLNLNKTELRMGEWLKVRKWKGGKYSGRLTLQQIRPMGISLRWGVDEKTGTYMTYTPDFVVTLEEESEDYHPSVTTKWVMIEVKGAHIRERDLVRFKGCRADWPEYDFEMWQWVDRQWRRVL